MTTGRSRCPALDFIRLLPDQGITTDGNQWYFSWQYGLEIANNQFRSVRREESGRREVEGIALRSARQVCEQEQSPQRNCSSLGDDAVDLYVEMVVDPDNAGNDLFDPNIHLSLYHYEALN